MPQGPTAVEVAWLAQNIRHSSTRVWLHLQWRLGSGVGGGGSGGVSTSPKILICWKSGKILENLGKIPEDPNKIPKYLGKIPENLGKNGTQRCLTSKNGAQGLQKNKWRQFFGGHTTKTVGKSCTTTFCASLRKFGLKSFAPPKICLLLHLCVWVSLVNNNASSH